jgi:hypothetical protein
MRELPATPAVVPVMREFRFRPPLTLANNIAVLTLDDAANFVRWNTMGRMISSQEPVLQRLELARTEDEQCAAAEGFLLWVRAEGLEVSPV